MPVSNLNSRITCFGTYTTLAAIMTDFAAAGGTFTTSVVGAKTIYTVPTHGFETRNGANISWNPETEELVCARTLSATTQAFLMNPTSSLRIGFEYTQGGKTLRTKGFGLRFDRTQTESTTTERGGRIFAGCSLVVYGDLQLSQTISCDGTMQVYGDIYGVAPTGTSDPSIRTNASTNFLHEGGMYTVRGGKPIRLFASTGGGQASVTRALSSEFENVVLQAQSGGAAPFGLLTYLGIRNATNSAATLLERSGSAANWQAGACQPVKFRNLDVGTGWTGAAGVSIAWTTQDVGFSVIDAEAGSLLTFKASVIGKNNNAFNPWTLGGGVSGLQMGLDFTSAQYLLYEFEGADEREVLLGVSYSAPTVGEGFFGYSRTGIKGEDIFPVRAVAYGYAGTSGDVNLPSATKRTIPLGLFRSTQVTEQNPAVVAAYTEADSTDKATDLAHLWLYNNFDGTNINPVAIKNAEWIDFGDRDVVINPQATLPFEVIGDTVTLRAQVFNGSVRARSVQFLNGAIVSGVYQDDRGSSVTIELTSMPPKAATCLFDPSTLETIHYARNETAGNQTYTVRFPPGSAGQQVRFVRELYGFQREDQMITLSAGFTRISLFDLPDIAITEPSQAAVEAYTSIDTPSKDYDRTAVFRLTEAGIKLGQIITRSGFVLEHGGFSKIIRQNASQVFSVSGSVITIRAASYDADLRYNMLTATGTATITAFGSELVNIDIEDANGDSTATIKGTSGGLVDVWKVPVGTINADYPTGTQIASNIGDGKFRFVSADGFKLIFFDKNSLLARDCSMSKGVYTLGWYIYNSETGGLTRQQSQDFDTMVAKVADIFADINGPQAEKLDSILEGVEAVPTAPDVADAVWNAADRTLNGALFK